MKKFLGIILSLCIILSCMCALTVEVGADSVDDAIRARIDQLYNLLGNTYFTTDRKSAGSSDNRSLNSNIIQQTWFKEMFGVTSLSVSQFPGSPRTYPEAKSCSGFASFAGWYIFKNSNSDYIKINELAKMSLTYSNVINNAKIGDIISLSGTKSDGSTAGHEFIFISADSSGMYVLDSNWGNSCKVTKHNISYSYCSQFQIGRATNRDSLVSTPPTAKLSIDRSSTNYNPGDVVTFTFGGNNSGTYTLGIYKGSERIDTVTVVGNTYSRKFNEVAMYSAYMTAYNSYTYADSNWVAWQVNDLTANLSINKTEIPQKDSITFTFGGNNSGTYANGDFTLGIYKDGVKTDTLTVKGTKYSKTFSETGSYKAYMTAYSNGGHKDSDWVYWTVKPSSYKISYNANSGSGAPSAQTKTYGTTLTLSSTKPTRTGYTFKNWNTKADGSGTSYKAGASYTANSAATLYAQWTANTYKITFNANGGTTPTTSKNVIYASAYGSLPKPIKAGHTFDGWYTSTSGGTKITSSSKVSESSAHNLYAHWSKHSSEDMLVPVSNMTYNGHYYLLFNDTTSWEFAEEYCKKMGGHLVTITNQRENDAIVSFVEKNNTDGSKHYWLGATSSNDNEDMSWITSETFTYSNWAEGEPDKAYGQYWMNIYPKTGKWNDYINVYQTTGFVCEFESFSEVPSVKITFNSMGLTEEIEPTIISYGSACGELPLPQKDGFIFKGWYTKEIDGEKVTNETVVASDIVLYAYWETTIPCTESTVSKSGDSYTISTNLHNLADTCSVLIACYKNNQLVTMKIAPYSEIGSPSTLTGDIDEIKVMAWSDLSTLKPLCDAEVIPESEFITE